MCEMMFPSLDVTLKAQELDLQMGVAVRSDDWKSMSDEEFISRSLCFMGPISPRVREILGKRVRFLKQGGEIVGRGCIVPSGPVGGEGSLGVSAVVTVGGAASNTHLRSIAGILMGRAVRAARDEAIVVASPGTLAAWATEQRELLEEEVGLSLSQQLETFDIVFQCGASSGRLPICMGRKGGMSASDLREACSSLDEILVMPHSIYHDVVEYGGPLELEDNVIVTGGLAGYVPLMFGNGTSLQPSFAFKYSPSFALSVVEEAWRLEEGTFGGALFDRGQELAQIGVRGEKPIEQYVMRLSRPIEVVGGGALGR
jgi:hypothetical protein